MIISYKIDLRKIFRRNYFVDINYFFVLQLYHEKELNMTPKQVIEHFKGEQQAAKGLGKSITCIRTWKANKKIPTFSQFAIQAITNGELKAGGNELRSR